MKYIEIPVSDNEPVVFYLAAEEFVARKMDDNDCFFMWQVAPSVIFGRNQLIENEVNLDYCRKHNIRTFRRKSGGGCVYADRSNIMFSYINSGEGIQFTFDRYVRMVAQLLQRLGLDAHTSNRNDVLIGDKKVSGNAFYHIPGRNIVHGTMLFDTNMENMVGSITPNDEKLISKGVQSVRQHITLLKDHLQMSLEEFKTYVRQNLCDSKITLTKENVDEIREIEKEYLTPEFIYGHNPRYTLTRKKRIEGCGDLEVRMEIKNGILKNINLMGDYFLMGDLDHGFLSHLCNRPFSPEAIRGALHDVHSGDYIMNLTDEKFVGLLFGS
jgi:lipoate-protein ligase A